ncbi:MAG TPA: DUF3037 domain-containing protein [Puia sp.]|uniref:DUF3037 domain-containing protein n=1 Tax=Puia sp. TaxID=2045100 RepID=UPI002B96A9CF|nr:DUF3037 domain-containing protein [Puia sp.]HVU98354.1 DUF3037 domain-containing protein [Puia sp.]
MPEKQLFEYAVIRVMPRVDREEFLNVGVIAYCHLSRWLGIRYSVNAERLRALDPKLDLEEVIAHLKGFEEIVAGSEAGGPIGQLDKASRFRWLTATRSTILQASKVHPGFCGTNMEGELERLFAAMVL